MFVRVAAVVALLSGCATASEARAQAVSHEEWAAVCEDWADWDKPGPPFRIFGNTWYVGTCGISAILVTGETGHVLIDGGTEAGGRLIAANIERLGFELSDVEFLLNSHEHHDHAGGLAYLQQATDGLMLASEAAAQVFASGTASPDDPQAAIEMPVPRIEVGRGIRDGDTVNLGFLKVTALSTPGHTPGALTWRWRSCEGDECRAIVYADSLSPISGEGYRFSDHPEYVEAYRAGLTKLTALECDILLTPHPSASRLRDRLLGGAPLVDGQACSNYAADIEVRLDERLFEEAGPE